VRTASGSAARPCSTACSLTRELVTEPANIIYPETFVERCPRIAGRLGVEIEVLDEKQMAELGMGALLGVGQGSVRRRACSRCAGTGQGTRRKPVVLVGKGITFDTGGISIKPAAGMEAMKWDMGGAGAVAGAMKAIAGARQGERGRHLRARREHAGRQRPAPGDVVTSMSGQTIEVINTDAEGRLVLADAMTWAQRQYQAGGDGRSRDPHRRDDHRARLRICRAVLQRRRLAES
jgi:leucyl aminopeptidase